MKVVGLISGGKDSILNLQYCIHLGHEVVCLANLYPEDDGKEMDSFMFQTVGVGVVPKIAEAIGLPLFRCPITGRSRNPLTNAYEPEDGDETEDLLLLLQDVLAQHPDVNAVSTGAILSDYQRLRVESVCNRLGLKSLAFIWRLGQSLLVDQMCETDMKAILVKTACMGLDERHLGKTVEELRPFFARLEQEHGFHVCGEGGEYETITLDGPLFQKKVKLPECTVIKHGGGAYYLYFSGEKATLEDKPGHKVPTQFPALDSTTSLKHYVSTFPIKHACSPTTATTTTTTAEKTETSKITPSASSREGCIYPITTDSVATSSLDRVVLGVQSMETRDFFAALQSFLQARDWSLRDAFYVELYVNDVSQFAQVNAAYVQHFPAPDPPARFCVEACLPADVPLRIRILLSKQTTPQRFATHVQSISTWGMTGPWSQSMRMSNGSVYISGVIGMVPHSMTLIESSALSPHIQSNDIPDIPQWSAELWMVMRTLTK